MNKKIAVLFSSMCVIIFISIFSMFTSTSLNDIEEKFILAKTEAMVYEATNQETETLENSYDNVISETEKAVSYRSNSKYKTYIDNILNTNINASMTDFDKIKAIHDYIIINTSYDTSSEIPDSSFSPEGVFVKGIAVCQGYAEAFQLFMEALDIPCEIVKGTANNISHAWNVVKVNGEWYQIDVTWDDPIIENQVVTGTANLSYSYFLKPDTVFYQDHIATSSPPACTSDKYLYVEQYYQIPYTILGSVNEIPDKFMEYYSTGVKSLTLYFPEDVDPAQTEILKDLYRKLYKQSGSEISFKYYPVARYINYSYITIFIE